MTNGRKSAGSCVQERIGDTKEDRSPTSVTRLISKQYLWYRHNSSTARRIMGIPSEIKMITRAVCLYDDCSRAARTNTHTQTKRLKILYPASQTTTSDGDVEMSPAFRLKETYWQHDSTRSREHPECVPHNYVLFLSLSSRRRYNWDQRCVLYIHAHPLLWFFPVFKR